MALQLDSVSGANRPATVRGRQFAWLSVISILGGAAAFAVFGLIALAVMVSVMLSGLCFIVPRKAMTLMSDSQGWTIFALPAVNRWKLAVVLLALTWFCSMFYLVMFVLGFVGTVVYPIALFYRLVLNDIDKTR